MSDTYSSMEKVIFGYYWSEFSSSRQDDLEKLDYIHRKYYVYILYPVC